MLKIGHFMHRVKCKNIFPYLLAILIFYFSLFSSAHSSNIEEELATIKKLFDDGILTLEEYENTKSILIEKAGGKRVHHH